MPNKKNESDKQFEECIEKEERKNEAKASYKKLVERNGPALKRLNDS
ncbi:hypothetical protein [Priestia megaterium]|nr:hypothetical protein [Priestia megaterium]MDY0943794.1 hypothetical protein [Priestia megaterium]